MPTISIVDNADGTSTATISGSDGGSTNSVYTGTWSGDAGSVSSWTLSGSRTGDGTVSLTLSDGYYWAYVISASGGDDTASLPFYWRQTSGEDSILKQIVDAVQARLQGMTFSALGSDFVKTIDSDDIVIAKVAQKQNRNTPGLVISLPGRVMMPKEAGTNIRDDIEYVVMVQIVDKDNDTETLNIRSYLKWQEQIAKAFRNQRVPGVSCAYIGAVNMLDNVDEKVWTKEKWFIASVELHFWARETRGIT